LSSKIFDDVKYIILDRDGTLIEHIHYLHDPIRVKLLSSVKKTLTFFKKNNYKLFLHTNQAGIGKNLFKLQDAISCNNRLIELLQLGDEVFDRICIATDLKSNLNNYRKPSPLFGQEIMKEYKINNKNIIYIGDAYSDLETAINLGCKGIGLRSKNFTLNELVNKNSNLTLVNNWNEIKNMFNSIK